MQEVSEAFPVIPVHCPPAPKAGPPALFDLIPEKWRSTPLIATQINDPEIRRAMKSMIREHGEAFEHTEISVDRDPDTGEIHVYAHATLHSQDGVIGSEILMPHEITANINNIEEYLCIKATEALYTLDNYMWENKPEVELTPMPRTPATDQPSIKDKVRLCLVDLEVLCPSDAVVEVARFQDVVDSPVKFVREVDKFAKEIQDGTYARIETSTDS
jgi:hypothetical protein